MKRVGGIVVRPWVNAFTSDQARKDSDRWLAQLQAIAVRVGDDRHPYAGPVGFDWPCADATFGEPGQETIEVVHQKRVERRPGARRVSNDIDPSCLGNPPAGLGLVWNQVGRAAHQSLVPAHGLVKVGDGDSGEEVGDSHPEKIARGAGDAHPDLRRQGSSPIGQESRSVAGGLRPTVGPDGLGPALQTPHRQGETHEDQDHHSVR